METNELIDILYPEHDRTSCSDDDILNGFSWELDEWNTITDKLDKRYLPRCRRCALLEIISDEVVFIDDNLKIIRKYVY
jgi:hypothetical protein